MSKKVTGIGGVFFKAKDAKTLNEWYIKHLGFKKTDDGQMLFEWRNTDKPEEKCFTVWGVFKESTTYFEPSTKDYMINLRVENLEELIAQLKKDGAQVIGDIQTYEYGKFGYVVDPEGNKIELWQPIDDGFTKQYEGKTIH